MPLATLPLELLQHIASYVEAVHQPSLNALSLTSKVCRAASAFLIFRQIDITVRNRERLPEDVETIIETLQRTDAARHVQCIIIKGDIRPYTKRLTMYGHELYQPRWDDGLDEMLGKSERHSCSGPHVVYDEPVIERNSAEDTAWAPVASLLRRIPHLKDLIYDCESQFPPSLLGTLRERHPQCRLHHLTFRFRTLLWGIPYPYELELATYPALHRVKVGCSRRDTNGDDDFNIEAVMELVAGLAPNLQEVIILSLSPAASHRYFRRRDEWQGLPGFAGKKKGFLTTLQLKGWSDLVSPTLLQRWARHTDFNCLQHLQLWGGRKTHSVGLTGETMEWMAQNHSFPRLKTLGVYLYRDDMFHERPHYSDNAVSFFQAFPALEELTVHGPIDVHIFQAIICHHGQKLRKLALHPSEANPSSRVTNGREQREIPLELTKKLISQIQAQCPLIEDLALPIKRDLSSASEASLYRSFSKMPKLTSLLLNLDCSNWHVILDPSYSPGFTGDDAEPVAYDTHYHEGLEIDHALPVTKGDLNKTFINAAVNEALARSIWELVSIRKTGARLERLKLWTTGGGEYGGYSGLHYLHKFVDQLSQSWLIERDPRRDVDDVVIRETGKRKRDTSETLLSKTVESSEGQVFRAIWPSKEGSSDWQDDWSSFLFPSQ